VNKRFPHGQPASAFDLVLMGVWPESQKELIAVLDGYPPPAPQV
jgi:hypothetical protein